MRAHDPTAEVVDQLLAQNAELGTALYQGLDIPLNALRASMESLSRELSRDGDSHGIIEGALEEVERLERNVRELMEFTSVPTPMPLRCTLAEIVLSARSGLPPSQRTRVLVAHEPEGAKLMVDGPLLACSLRRLVLNALEAGSEQVLLVARREEEATRFTVVDDAPEKIDVEWAMPAFRSTRRNHLGLGLAIAKRDVALLLGKIDFAVSKTGDKLVTVTIPDQVQERAA